MTLPAIDAHWPDDSSRGASAASLRSPLLAPLLVGSLILHAAVFGLWPDTEVPVSASVPAAAQIAVRMHTDAAAGNHTATRTAPAPRSTSHSTSRAPSQPARPMPDASKPSARAVAVPRATPPAPPAVTTHASVRPATTPPTTATDNGDRLRNRVHGSLQRALLAHFEYPPVARRRGWEGVVQVGLRVEADGQLSGLRLVATSGHALLDRAALQSLGRVGRLPDVIDWLQGRQLDMILPVRYRLIDS